MHSPAKSVDSDIVETARPTRTTRTRHAPDPGGDEEMIDDDDDAIEDPMQRMLRQAREAKSKRNVSKSTSGSNAGPSRAPASEEPEEVERRRAPEASRPVVPKSEPSPVKPKTKGGAKQMGDAGALIEPTKDERFLTAITTASKKAKIDQLDEEFNNLRILKPSKAKVQVQPADHPDWNMVEGFDDDITGNFIQIVKVDLFRKDGGGKKKVQQVDDGRANFKKFRKASEILNARVMELAADIVQQNVPRREPLNLVIAAPIVEDAEMGEGEYPTP